MGKIEIILGSMFSGKTTELIRRANRYKIAGYKTACFKHCLDCKRTNKNDLQTHDKNSLEAISIESPKEIINYVNNNHIDVIAIDEVQFFDKSIITTVRLLDKLGNTIILAGLDMDYNGNSFFNMGELCCIADEVVKLHAICNECGQDARYSYRKSNNNQIIEVGGKEEYMALCSKCFERMMNNKHGMANVDSNNISNNRINIEC